MPTTATGNIEYWYTGEYREEYGPDGNAGTVGINTLWEDYDSFPAAMLGTNKSVNDGTGISRTIPEVHRAKPWMYCSGLKLVSVSGGPLENPDDGTIDFVDAKDSGKPEYARWEAIFTGPKYVLKPDADGDGGPENELYRFIQVMPEYSVEFLEQPGNTWVFKSDGKPISQPVTIPLQCIHYVLRWWWVPYASIQFDLLGQYQNSANSEPFKVQKINAAPGQLLFNGFSFGDYVYDAGGTLCLHVDMSFLFRATGWNSFFRNNRAGGPPIFDAVTDKTKMRSPFLLNDLTELFTS